MFSIIVKSSKAASSIMSSITKTFAAGLCRSAASSDVLGRGQTIGLCQLLSRLDFVDQKDIGRSADGNRQRGNRLEQGNTACSSRNPAKYPPRPDRIAWARWGRGNPYARPGRGDLVSGNTQAGSATHKQLVCDRPAFGRGGPADLSSVDDLSTEQDLPELQLGFFQRSVIRSPHLNQTKPLTACGVRHTRPNCGNSRVSSIIFPYNSRPGTPVSSGIGFPGSNPKPSTIVSRHTLSNETDLGRSTTTQRDPPAAGWFA